jgi:1-acyl-sn-glycerol-3-phosphate acyltransferase
MKGVLRHPLRVSFRLLGFMGVVGFALADFLLFVQLPGRAKSPLVRAQWLQRWARCMMRVINLRAERRGSPPARGLLASNHVSYLDIVVLASHCPLVFVSKAEVERWPVMGWCTRCAGTLFLKREQRGDVSRVAAQFAPLMEAGVPVVVFLEGTSTGGDRVLPFRPSLLEPAVANQWPVTPGWIGYSLDDGSVEDDIAYWRDMVFGPHLLNLLSKRAPRAHVAFGREAPAGLDRKELARHLHAEVCALAGRFGRRPARGAEAPIAG